MYQDKMAIMQVLGTVLKNPMLLADSSKYNLINDDFPEKFHKIIFASIYNLHNEGVEVINEVTIDGFLKDYDIQYAIFNDNDGIEYLYNIQELAEESNFDHYYKRLKKFSLIREMSGLGFDIKEIYDDELFDPKEKEEMQKKFDRLSIEDILKVYETKVIEVKDKFKTNSDSHGTQAGKGAVDLLKRLKQSPDIGAPLNSKMLTSVARGARKKKFYIRSSFSGGGKTRHMIADACNLSATHVYDLKEKEWVKNEFTEHSTVISTEMLEHCKDWQNALLQMYENTKPGGIFILTCASTNRQEHGTNVHSPQDSKFTLDWYRNISVEDFESVLPKELFSECSLGCYRGCTDLYFYGIKKGS